MSGAYERTEPGLHCVPAQKLNGVRHMNISRLKFTLRKGSIWRRACD
jgi:hypothetical protein